MALENAVRFLVDLGLVDVVLPFILVFAVVYALLQRTLVLGTEKGEPRSALNATVAFVFAFFAVASLQQVDFIKTFSGIVGVGVVVVLVVAMIGGLIGAKSNSKLLLGSGVVVAIAGLLIILSKLGLLPDRLSDLSSPEWGIPFFLVLAFFVVGWFIVSASPTKYAEKPAEKEKAAEAAPGKGQTAGAAKPGKLVKELSEKELEKPGFIWGR